MGGSSAGSMQSSPAHLSLNSSPNSGALATRLSAPQGNTGEPPYNDEFTAPHWWYSDFYFVEEFDNGHKWVIFTSSSSPQMYLMTSFFDNNEILLIGFANKVDA